MNTTGKSPEVIPANQTAATSSEGSFLLPVTAFEKLGILLIPVFFGLIGIGAPFLFYSDAAAFISKINPYLFVGASIGLVLAGIFGALAFARIRTGTGLEIKNGCIYIHQIDRKLKLEMSGIKSLSIYPAWYKGNGHRAWMMIKSAKKSYILAVPNWTSARDTLQRSGVSVQIKGLGPVVALLMAFVMSSLIVPKQFVFVFGLLQAAAAYYCLYRLRVWPLRALLSVIFGPLFVAVLILAVTLPMSSADRTAAFIIRNMDTQERHGEVVRICDSVSAVQPFRLVRLCTAVLTFAKEAASRDYSKAIELSLAAISQGQPAEDYADVLTCAYLGSGQKELALEVTNRAKLQSRVDLIEGGGFVCP